MLEEKLGGNKKAKRQIKIKKNDIFQFINKLGTFCKIC